MTVDGEGIVVTFANERQHRVEVRERNDCYELSGIVARAAAIEGVEGVPLRAWRRNRATQLVGFRIDPRGRIVGEAWVPKEGLTRDEFLLYARRVAAECDVFEHQLTGEDHE